MKKVLSILLLLISFYGSAQVIQPVTGKSRYMNGLYFGCRDSSYYSNGADTAVLYFSCADSSVYFRYKGYFRKIAYKNEVDTSLAKRVRYIDTAAMLSNLLRKTDTTTMLSGYARSGNVVKYSDTTAMLSNRLKISDTATMLSNRLKISDTSTALSGYQRKNFSVQYTDSASMLSGYARSGNVVKYTDVGVSNGVASLDAGGKVPFSQLPASLMIYKGTWSAATNTPTLADGTGTTGWVYKSTTNGTVNFGSGNITFYAGDWVIYNGSVWERSVGTDNVVSVSVNGSAAQQGVVSITLPNASVTNAMLANSTISGIALGNNLNSVTFNNGGTGAASGSTYNGSGAVTVSYNTVGAPSTTGTNASGNWPISITGSAGSVTNGVYTTGNQSIAGIKTFTDSIIGTASRFTGAVTAGNMRLDPAGDVEWFNGSSWQNVITFSGTNSVAVPSAFSAGAISGTTGTFSGRLNSGGGGGGTSSLNAQQASGDASAIAALGVSTTGSSNGVKILAGTNSSDYSLDARNYSGTSLFYVRGDGNVGVGTNSPANVLQVGSVGSTGFAGNQFAIGNGTNAFGISVDNTSPAMYSNAGMRFFTAGAVALTIASNQTITAAGNISITKTSPYLFLYNSTTSNGAYSIAAPSGGGLVIANDYGGVNVLSFNTSNNAAFYGSIQTAAPTGYTAAPWKFGTYTAGGWSGTGYIVIEINGTIYSIPALVGTP